MTLQESLDKIKIRIESSLSPETVAIMHQATADLENSGITQGIVKEGDIAPEIILQNQEGVLVSSNELLKKSALVITFYRGIWCPYCNTDLANLKRYTQQLKDLNTSMVSISPQVQVYNYQIITQQRLNFDLLTDPENNVAHAFGLRWAMEDPLKSLYRDSFGISLPNYNGDESWTLPIPSRFIIGQDGIIKYAEFSVDYTKRPNPDVLIENLEKCI